MLENFWLVHPQEAMCGAFAARCAGLPGVKIFRGRFEELPPHDCFVTAGDAFGIMTAGIDAAVVHRFGQSIMLRVQERIRTDYRGEQPVGSAFVIETGDSAIPFLCHAPTMRVPGSIEGTDKVYCATWAALLAIHAHNRSSSVPIKTAAFPAMGAGFGGVPFDEVARQIAAAWRHYLNPPAKFDWDFVAQRQLAICYGSGKWRSNCLTIGPRLPALGQPLGRFPRMGEFYGRTVIKRSVAGFFANQQATGRAYSLGWRPATLIDNLAGRF